VASSDEPAKSRCEAMEEAEAVTAGLLSHAARERRQFVRRCGAAAPWIRDCSCGCPFAANKWCLMRLWSFALPLRELGAWRRQDAGKKLQRALRSGGGFHSHGHFHSAGGPGLRR